MGLISIDIIMKIAAKHTLRKAIKYCMQQNGRIVDILCRSQRELQIANDVVAQWIGKHKHTELAKVSDDRGYNAIELRNTSKIYIKLA